ncbi:MAG: hypothetical protein US31_C0001G0062 [Berkelbacteria bacterium GW2011_GWA1_36_9]|uniref:Uncharacterized protein n=1 Tax=Berkelbacteria bacterium GW2011_GWA1_36_9 TaxID=1618331 RepID=A0A0G0FYL7_9BACT|nr:MAG: hypothetical protein US31_C0001G0062 [Berkelbacteria bacterium GW2011_GWA1_36_9]
MEYLIYPLMYFLVIGGIIFVIVKATAKRKPGAPPIDWRQFGVGTAIMFVLPFFIGFSTSAVFNELAKTESLIMMLVMAVIFLIVGFTISHHTVISTSLIAGSIIAIIYAIGINLESISPSVMAILAGLGVAILIYIAYKKFQEQEAK